LCRGRQLDIARPEKRPSEDVRHRADVVEYRVERFADILGERLRALRVGGKHETVKAES